MSWSKALLIVAGVGEVFLWIAVHIPVSERSYYVTLAVLQIVLGFIYGASLLNWTFDASRERDTSASKTFAIAVSSYVFWTISFAMIYWLASALDGKAFNCALDQFSAVYFSLTTMATVGFGDILPSSALARVAVSLQIVAAIFFNLIVFAMVAGRIIANFSPERERSRDVPGLDYIILSRSAARRLRNRARARRLSSDR